MKLGFQLGHWGKDTRLGGSELLPHQAVAKLEEAESWGCSSVWVPESYFAEAFTFLSWIGAHTKRMQLGSCVIPIQARTPVNCAQSALTLDHLSGGRVMVGLGVTSINVAEGWYGQPFERPLARTREYLAVMRAVLSGERPENADATFYPLPVPGGVGSQTRALKSPVRPLRRDLPVLLGAIGPRNTVLAAEIADGWLPAFFIPEQAAEYKALLDEGFARPGARRSWRDFMVAGPVSVVVDDDLERAANRIRQSILYLITVMGSDERNFQLELFARAGFEAEAHTARSLAREGRHGEAMAAIPLAMVDAVALVGPRARVRDNLARWTSTYITHLVARGSFDSLRAIAEMGSFD
jgi:F420-dependent oxidoreductase-like protein